MVAGDGKDEDLGDVYELLGLEEGAGDKEVQTAYRKGSLQCHPDRNPDDPAAAEKFERLTRAKELLLNPAKRAEYDNKRKAARELEQRFANESAKRRKFREDLEGRENEAAVKASAPKASPQATAAEARKKVIQEDFAARIKAKEAKLEEKQAGVAAEAAEVRADAEARAAEARVRVVWRGEGSVARGLDAIKEALSAFDVQAIDVRDSEALVQLGSREDALRAVLRCRERKHQLPFRVSLAPTSEKAAASQQAARSQQAKSVPKQEPTPKEGGHGVPPAAAAPTGPGAGAQDAGTVPASGNFDDWEAKMMANLRNLAAAQKKAKAES